MKQAIKKILEALILALVLYPAALIADSGEDEGGVSRAEVILKQFGGSGSNSQASDTAKTNQTTATTSTFTVISPGDNSDYLAGDGECGKFLIQPPVFVPCTFRAAIEEANAHPGLDIIEFDVTGGGAQSLTPATPYDSIIDPVTIDGTTQPGFAGTPIIELNGTSAGNIGLILATGNSTVKGLVINRFSSGILSLGDNNLIAGNFIGTDATGTVDLGNLAQGVVVWEANNNVIGGTAPGSRNVISGNNDAGIWLFGTSTSGNLIAGNYIGTDASGTASLGNAYGISVTGSGGAGFNNTMGGTTAAARNIISGNAVGIWMFGSNNIIQGNYIGTDVSGAADLGNSGDGIFISIGNSNVIGGTVPGARNIISGNDSHGIGVQTISNNNVIQGNFIGTDVTGTAALGNSGSGIEIVSSDSNVIGGTTPPARNVISGNVGNGILLRGTSAQFMSRANLVQGNFIGTDSTGGLDLGNVANGIGMLYADNNSIGGMVAGEGNVISGNGRDGLNIQLTGPVGNWIEGNLIGTGVDGVSPIGNDSNGVRLYFNAVNNIIGGATPGARNTISFSAKNGIAATHSSATGNTFSDNLIFSNTGLGIDLFADGVTPNDPLDADTGYNNLQNFPVITIAFSDSFTTIQGLLHSAANNSFIVEFFSNDSCDASGYGEGQTYIGSDTVVTDSSGNAIVNVAFPVAVAEGKSVTAVATDSAGSTSEFCQCQIVVACLAMPGDANSNGDFSLGDILAIVNYYFNKPGWPACASNTKLCWVSDLLCRGDWTGNGEISLADVIQAVNKYFNKPGNWSPVATGVCCLPAP
jgi:titin